MFHTQNVIRPLASHPHHGNLLPISPIPPSPRYPFSLSSPSIPSQHYGHPLEIFHHSHRGSPPSPHCSLSTIAKIALLPQFPHLHCWPGYLFSIRHFYLPNPLFDSGSEVEHQQICRSIILSPHLTLSWNPLYCFRRRTFFLLFTCSVGW